MRARWLLIAAFTTALGALGYYVSINTEWREVTLPMPLRGEAATNAQYTLQAFMRELGTDVHTEQSLLSMPPTDAAIFLKNWHWDLIESRREKLQAWVQAGGRLIVDNTVVGDLHSFADWSGIERHYPADKSTQRDSAQNKKARPESGQQTKVTTPNIESPSGTSSDDATSNDDSVEPDTEHHAADDADHDTEVDEDAETEEATDEPSPLDESQCTTWTANNSAHNKEQHYRDHYRLCAMVSFGWLTSKTAPLWSLRDERGLRVVRIAVGQGSITYYNVLPFDNRALPKADHAALSVAITQLRHHDQVWFITEGDQASIFSLAWRYGSPVVILLAAFIAISLWRNAVRFGPQAAPTETSRRSLAELIRGSGWFYERQGDSYLLDAAIERALRETAQRHIRGFASLAPAKQAAALAMATGFDQGQLQAALQTLAQPTHSRTRARHERRRAIALLEMVRRKLVETKPHHRASNASLNPSLNPAVNPASNPSTNSEPNS